MHTLLFTILIQYQGINTVHCKQEHSEDELCFNDMRSPDCADITASIAVTGRLT